MKYSIRKGGRYAWPPSVLFHKGKTSDNFQVEFSKESAVDIPEDLENDWSKLRGWSYGYHMRNSIRVGWRPSDLHRGCIDLSLFKHDDWVKVSTEEFITVAIDKPIICKIRYNPSIEHFTLHVTYYQPGLPYRVGKHLSIPFPITHINRIGYILKFHYGGTYASVGNISAKFKRL